MFFNVPKPFSCAAAWLASRAGHLCSLCRELSYTSCFDYRGRCLEHNGGTETLTVCAVLHPVLYPLPSPTLQASKEPSTPPPPPPADCLAGSAAPVCWVETFSGQADSQQTCTSMASMAINCNVFWLDMFSGSPLQMSAQWEMASHQLLGRCLWACAFSLFLYPANTQPLSVCMIFSCPIGSIYNLVSFTTSVGEPSGTSGKNVVF